MNDLPNAVENVEITMFADDTSLSTAFQNTDELWAIPHETLKITSF